MLLHGISALAMALFVALFLRRNAPGFEAPLVFFLPGALYAAPIGRAPSPNGRLFAVSRDGGQRWQQQGLAQQLSTPVCQASVATLADGTLLFSNPAHTRSRVRMTVARSVDEGVTWEQVMQVFPAPAGYSALGVLGSGDVLLAYENGDLSYSRRISVAHLQEGLFGAAGQPGIGPD